jgi:chromate reductase, NAD(P)H dehydrogenase (quinone)
LWHCGRKRENELFYNRRKNIFAIVGSTSKASFQKKPVEFIAGCMNDGFTFAVHNDLKTLPPFDPEASINNPPAQMIGSRKKIEIADAVLICTPRYVFSIPSGLKTLRNGCVSTTVFPASRWA